MGLGELIEKALKDAGVSQAEAARQLKVTPQAVHGWIRTGTIGKKKLAELARLTGANLEGLMLEREEHRVAEGAAADDYLPRLKRPSGVPIIGFAIATPNEDGYFDEMYLAPGTSDDYVEFITTDPDAYALIVKGDSMAPRIRPAEAVVVEPRKALVQGEDVLVRTKAGRKMVKQYLFQRGGQVTLGSINQAHPQITLSTDDIESMHRATPARTPRESA